MNDFKKCLSDEHKAIYLQELNYILSAPKKLTKENEKYLINQAEEIGFNPTEIKTLKKIKTHQEAAKLLKTIGDMRLKRFILREMVMLAIADHEISDTEMCDIYCIGTNVGVKEEKINDFFLWAAEGIEWQLQGRRLVMEDL